MDWSCPSALAVLSLIVAGCGAGARPTVTADRTGRAGNAKSPLSTTGSPGRTSPATPIHTGRVLIPLPTQGQVVTLPGVGSIRYVCQADARAVASTFTSAHRSATDHVSVSENGNTITRGAVQPSDPGTGGAHTLSTPFAAYHSLDWVVTQVTEPQLIVARVRLDFVLTTASADGARYAICNMPRWTVSVRSESHSGPVEAVERVPRY